MHLGQEDVPHAFLKTAQVCPYILAYVNLLRACNAFLAALLRTVSFISCHMMCHMTCWVFMHVMGCIPRPISRCLSLCFSVVMFEVEMMSFVDYKGADEFASFPEVCTL